jgi:DNA primase
MRTTSYADVKALPFEVLLLDHYGIRLEHKVIKGEEKLIGSCPIHKHAGEPNPRSNQFQVTVKALERPKTNNTFHCFGCGARGTIVDFVVLMEKLVRYDSIDWTEVRVKRESGEDYNWVPTEKLKLASQLISTWFLEGDEHKKPEKISTSRIHVHGADTSQPSKTLVNATWVEMWGSPAKYSKSFTSSEYLASRGISEATLDEFGVGFYNNPRTKSQLQGRILFPLQNIKGEHIGYASRTVKDEEPRYVFPPATRERDGVVYQFDRSVLLWNLHRLDSKEVFIVEGFFGCMNLHQHDYPAVALMGSNLSEAQATLIEDHFQQATFVLDPDDAGKKLAVQAMNALQGRIVLKLVLPSVQADQMTEAELKTLLA